MKLIYLIYFTLLFHIPVVWSQPGHQTLYFNINYELFQGIDKDSLLNTYNIRTGIFTENDGLQFSEQSIQELDSIYNSKFHHRSIGVFENNIILPIIFPGISHALPTRGKVIKKGSVIGFSLESKKTKQKMNVFIRIGKTVQVFGDDHIGIASLRFQAGNFFYDLCMNKYLQEELQGLGSLWVSLNKLDKHAIRLGELNKVLEDNDCTEYNFVFSLPIINPDNESLSFYIYYENQDLWGKAYHMKTIPQKENTFSLSITPYLLFNSSQNRKNSEILGISIHNIEEDKKMLIYFKIYKRYEDYNRNQITLKNFKFQEGIFYYDMKTYQAGDCETPRFIDEFDLSNIQEYVITEEEMNQILEEYKEVKE